jgi:lysophospholipase L1-like esterase
VTAKITLAALTMLLMLALFEVGLRAFTVNPFAGEDLDHILRIQRQHAGADRVLDRSAIDPEHPQVRFRTDHRGYIRPSIRYEDPDVTIAFLGGSTTECSAVREELRFPSLVAELLAAEGIKANTLNAGRSGNTTQDSLNLLLNHVVLDQPDVVVLMHAVNDVGVTRRAGSYRSRMGGPVGFGPVVRWGLEALSIKLYTAARVRMLANEGQRMTPDRWYAARKVDRPVEPILRQFRSRIAAFVHLSRDLGIYPVLMTQLLSPTTNALTPEWSDLEWQDYFNNTIREVADALDVTLIDLAVEVPRRHPDWREPMRLFYDGMHVTDRGSEAYAAIIAEHLRATILAKAPPFAFDE